MKDNFEQNNLKGSKAPKICYTAGGILIHDKKVLLIKHKKLGLWLNPGGHIDEGELPHEAAEREFFEETGVKVKAVDVFSLPTLNDNYSISDPKKESQFMPNPMSTNLHWVNHESYKLRQVSDTPNRRISTKLWKRGCEQHVGFFYLLKATDGVSFKQNTEETYGIAWFGLDEIDDLFTAEAVKQEIKLGFKFLGIE
jgi:8-oxo-dGTP pyrophosphatase MutT (NUDIX family)